jgi:hypothetical protein
MSHPSMMLVIWGKWFEEATASVFVTELRKAGFHVKVVSLTQKIVTGSHGLALVPDWTLEQALVAIPHILGIVIPCDMRGIQSVRDDPRFLNLIHQASIHNIPLILKQVDIVTSLQIDMAEIPPSIQVYPESEALVPFVRQMVGTLMS